MNRSHRLAAVCGILLLVSVCGFLSSTANGRDTAPKVLLMLDSSGSMEDGDPSGGTKMDAAKNALAHAFDAASPNVEVGLRVYGADVDVNSTSGYCADSRLAHPVGVLDKAVLASAVNQFQPRGGSTPIVYALKEGAKDLGDRGERRIILVSDGGETCSPDPCREVRDLVAGGTSPQIDIVGFGVGDTVRQQLSCIAEAGGGAYYDAKDADSLETSLQQLGAEATHELAAADATASGKGALADVPVVGRDGGSPAGDPGWAWSDQATAAVDVKSLALFGIGGALVVLGGGAVASVLLRQRG